MRPLERNLRLGELFAGYGGLGLAVEEVFGAELAWVSEWEAAPSKILAHHWPHVPNYGDVTKIDWTAIEPVDIISGGSPCQDLSMAGKRLGMTEGTRSNLWESMREGIATIKPKYVVWENVRGALSAGAVSEMEQSEGRLGDGGGAYLRAIGRVLGDLADLGYDAEWRGLRASDVGAPHARFRVFILAAHRDHAGRGEQRRAFPIRQEYPATQHPSSDAPNPNRGNDDGRLENAQRRQERGKATTWSRGGHPSAGPHWGEYEPAVRRWEDRLGRPAPRPTEPTGRDGGPRLSPRFTEWMMGLPDYWVTDPAIGITRNEQLKACGNGVVPQQAVAALRDMLFSFQQVRQAA